MQDTIASPQADCSTSQPNDTSAGVCTEEPQPVPTDAPPEETQQAAKNGGSLWGSMFGAMTGAAGAIGGAAMSAGGTVTSAVTGAAGAVGSTAMQASGAIGGAAMSAGETVASAVTGAAGAVGNTAMQAGGAIGGAAMSAGGTVASAVTGAAGAVGSTAMQAGGAIGGTAVGVAMAVGNVAMQSTDGIGYVVDLIANNPQLKELTKNLQVDWLLAIIDRVDVVQAETRVRDLQQQHPQEKPHEIAHHVMLEKALYVGGTGFASSLMPGMAAPMFTVDFAATMALQAEMIYQIAAAYGLDLKEASRKGEILTIFGMTLGCHSAIKLGLGLARNIPIAGAIIGASSNAAMLYALGYAACRFYEKKFDCAGSSAEDWADSQKQADEDLQSFSSQQLIMDQILCHIVMTGNPDKTLLQLLPELQTLNLSPESLAVIQTHLESLPSLEELLPQLSQDFGVSLVAQCYKAAQMDGVITEQESQVIDLITQKFSTVKNPV